MNDPIVIIEANECCPNIPRSINNFAAYEAAHAKGLPWKIIPYENLESLSSTEVESAIPSGTIKFVNWFFEAQGLKYPALLDYPTELRAYLNRSVSKAVLSDLIASWGPSGPPRAIFIKPLIQKRFTGFVLRSEGWVKQLSDIDPNQEVWTSEVINPIYSEWRVFILDGKILDIRPYRQSLDLARQYIPHARIIDQMIQRFTSSPRAYALDIGFMDNKRFYEDVMETFSEEQFLIEVNDSLALGTYGLESYKYLDMLIARWKEIKNV